MEFYLVYIANASGDSGCDPSIVDSRIFSHPYAASAYYSLQRLDRIPDCMQIFRCEFINSKLTPVHLLQECGHLKDILGIQI